MHSGTPMAKDAPFIRMAERIAAIEPAEFAGACVIQPPGDAEPIAFVTSDPSPDVIQFLAAVKARIEIAYAEAMQGAEDRRTGWSR